MAESTRYDYHKKMTSMHNIDSNAYAFKFSAKKVDCINKLLVVYLTHSSNRSHPWLVAVPKMAKSTCRHHSRKCILIST